MSTVSNVPVAWQLVEGEYGFGVQFSVVTSTLNTTFSLSSFTSAALNVWQVGSNTLYLSTSVSINVTNNTVTYIPSATDFPIGSAGLYNFQLIFYGTNLVEKTVPEFLTVIRAAP